MMSVYIERVQIGPEDPFHYSEVVSDTYVVFVLNSSLLYVPHSTPSVTLVVPSASARGSDRPCDRGARLSVALDMNHSTFHTKRHPLFSAATECGRRPVVVVTVT